MPKVWTFPSRHARFINTVHKEHLGRPVYQDLGRPEIFPENASAIISPYLVGVIGKR